MGTQSKQKNVKRKPSGPPKSEQNIAIDLPDNRYGIKKIVIPPFDFK